MIANHENIFFTVKWQLCCFSKLTFFWRGSNISSFFGHTKVVNGLQCGLVSNILQNNTIFIHKADLKTTKADQSAVQKRIRLRNT